MEKSKIFITAGIISAVGALVTGIYLFYKRQIKLALQYCYKISDIRLFSVKKDAISFDLTVKIQNRSDFNLQINGYDLDILMNGRKVANVKSNRTYYITPASISDITLGISFNPSEIFDSDFLSEIVSYMIVDQKKIVLQITGTLTVTMDFIKYKKFKFDYQTTVSDIINMPKTENVKCDIV